MKNLRCNSNQSKCSEGSKAIKMQAPVSSKLSRRRFVKKTLISGVGVFAGTAGLMAQSARPKKIAPSDKIVLGVIGLGGRNCGGPDAQGMYIGGMIQYFIKQGAEIAYVCDVDTRRYEKGLNACRGQSKTPTTVQDFRRILDDKNVTAMLISPGTHWGPLATIMSCQAGKDVYVEKPMSHDVYEGRKMVEAARKYQKIVQVGCQNRSGQYHANAIEFLKAGKIGKIHHIRVLNKLRGRLGKPGPYPEMPIPKEVDYDMWCGPAPKRPYNTNKTGPGVWRYFWEYSGADSESIHQFDIASWIITELTGRGYPNSVYSHGIVRNHELVADVPDSLTAVYDCGEITLSFEVDWWTTQIKVPTNIRESNTLFPDWQFTGTRIEIFGTEGMMYLGRHGGGWQTFDAKGNPGPQEAGIMPTEAHVKNFIDCIQSRNLPNGDIEKSQISQSMVHMAYISYRVGNQLLKIDGKNERFIGNNQANKLLARPGGGRAPWKIPRQV